MRHLTTLILLISTSQLLYAQCGLPSGFDATGNEFDVKASTGAGGTAMASSYSGIEMEISTPFEVDQDLELDDCDVEIVQSNEITVKSGVTFDITNGTLITTDNSPWIGIIVEDGGELIVDGSSIICHAETAIHIKISTSGDVTVEDAILENNYRGIEVDEYTAGLHPATVTGTTFQGGTLPTGLSAAHSSIGIQIDSVSDGGAPLTLGFQLGDPNENANEFYDLDLGVEAVNSTIFVQNCDFFEIDKVNAALNLGIAIRTLINDATLTTADCFIGTSVARENYFEDCRFGIQADGHEVVRIANNRMKYIDGPFISGIFVENSIDTVVIAADSIEGFKDFGIRSLDNETSIMSIRENYIATTVASASCDVTGIEVHESVGTGAVIYEVENNTIDGVQIGIELANTESMEVNSNTVSITQNLCTSTTIAGINAESADDILISANNVSSDCTSGTTTCTDQEFIGIACTNSPGVLLDGNTVEYIGYGILLVNDNADGNAVCNILNYCGKGFGFNSVTDDTEWGPVEDVASAGEPSDNKWEPSPTADRTHCYNGSDGATFDWYYRDGSSSPAGGTEHDASIDNTAGTSFGTTPVAPTSVTSTELDCGSMRLADWGTVNHSRTYVNSAILDELVSLDFSATSLKQSIHNYLELAQIREQEETIVLDRISETNIAKIQEAEGLLLNDLSSSALTVLDGLSAKNEWESWEVRMLTIIAKAKDRRTSEVIPFSGLGGYLTAQELHLVDSVASLSTEVGGDASSMARVLLNRIEIGAQHSFERSTDQYLLAYDAVDVYPNPAQDILHVATNQQSAEMTLVEVYDIAGIRLLVEQFAGNHLTLDVSKLQPGVYFISALLDDRETPFKSKFVKR